LAPEQEQGGLFGDKNRQPSAHLRRPTPLADHVIRPALAAADQVLALGDLAAVQLAGE
jgi:hypothetical protein